MINNTRTRRRSSAWPAFDKSASHGGGTGIPQDSLNIFAAMDTPPTAARQTLINNAVVSLKAAGLWNMLDTLIVEAAATAQAGLINWIQPANVATAVNAPTFVADRGYTGDGATSYLNTNRAMGIGPNFSQNNFHVGFWTLNDVSDSNAYDLGVLTGANTFRFNGRNATNNFAGNALATPAFGMAVADSIGHYMMCRDSASTFEGYKNKVSIGTDTDASVAAFNSPYTILANRVVQFSTRQQAMTHAGAFFTAAQVTAFYDIMLVYMQAVGAA